MKLFHRQETQALILDSIPSIVVLVDSDGIVTEWNRAAGETLGIEAEKALGKRLDSLAIDWDSGILMDCVNMVLEQGKPQRLNHMDFTLPDDRKGILGIALAPLQDRQHGSAGCILQGAEITDRKRLESQLAHAQKMESIGQLAAGIAHEINTPTQYIGDNIRFLQEAFEEFARLPEAYEALLKETIGDPLSPEIATKLDALSEELDLVYLSEEIPQAIEQSIQGIEQVSRIVRAMKQFSYPDNLEKTAADINGAIENTVTVTRNEWKYIAEVTLELDPELPLVPCLLGDFNQVILNILVNAAHAIGEKLEGADEQKGKITVTTRAMGHWAEIRISDTGKGIPETVRSRIFDPFFTTKEVGKGTGQGLAIAYSIVAEKHNGTITFETKEGEGTTFIIRLPLEESERD